MYFTPIGDFVVQTPPSTIFSIDQPKDMNIKIATSPWPVVFLLQFRLS